METNITEWRTLVARGPVGHRDVDELEAHLRDQIADLEASGLSDDEAFLVAVKRLGTLDELSREFAAERGGRLWRQLVPAGEPGIDTGAPGWARALGFAAAAGLVVLITLLVAGYPASTPDWLGRNAGLLVLPVLAAYLATRQDVAPAALARWAVPVAVVALAVNLYPYADGSSTEALVATHLPVLLWAAVGFAYVGGAIGSHERRMDAVRFTGEWVIYLVLIALGGGVLTGLTAAVLEPAGVDAERVAEWVLPLGAAGAVVVAAWLVQAKQSVVENMAPVLTMVFTPLFAVMLVVATVAYAVSGFGGVFDRELLALFDVLLVVVLGLVLYATSARDPERGPGWMDRVQAVAVAAALVLDALVLGAMVARIGDLGLTPNRVAALGLNVVLLVNLAGAAWHLARFLTGRGTFHRLETWQTTYLPVFAAWLAFVVLLLPPLFGFA
jgi:hypothetical protein